MASQAREFKDNIAVPLIANVYYPRSQPAVAQVNDRALGLLKSSPSAVPCVNICNPQSLACSCFLAKLPPCRRCMCSVLDRVGGFHPAWIVVDGAGDYWAGAGCLRGRAPEPLRGAATGAAEAPHVGLARLAVLKQAYTV